MTKGKAASDNPAASHLAFELAKTTALLEEARNTIRSLEGENHALTIKTARAEAAADAYRHAGGRMSQMDPRVLRALVAMTPKQHAVLQLVLRGQSNEQIAEAFKLTNQQKKELGAKLGSGESYMPMSVSTVKGMIRAVGKHLGLGSDGDGGPERMTRAEIISLVKGTVDAMGAEDYARTTNLPRDWADKRPLGDHLKHHELYSTKRDIRPPPRKRRP